VKYGEVSSFKNGYNLSSFLGRVNIYVCRSLLRSVTIRFADPPKLGETYKWGFFPSASLAWVMSDEDIMKDSMLSMKSNKEPEW
jgi:hypothetical protein